MAPDRWWSRRKALKLGATGSVGVVGASALVGGRQGDGTIDECTTIDESGEYELTDDLTADDGDACISIEAADVTLDGNGHVLYGHGSNTGIEIWDPSTNVTVENCTIRGFERGIFVAWGGLEIEIASVTIGASTGPGVFVRDHARVTLKECTIRDNDDAGVDPGEWSRLTVSGCELRENDGSAIRGSVSNSVHLEDSVVVDNGGPVSFSAFPVGESTIERTEIRGSDGAGLRTGGVDETQLDEPVPIMDCEIVDNDGPGIAHDNSAIDVRRCLLANNEDGYRWRWDRRSEATLRYNDIQDNEGYGMIVEDSEAIERIDARCNWWGHPTGPDHEDNPREDPQGDAIEGDADDVEFIPWSVRPARNGDGLCVGGEKAIGYIGVSSYRNLLGEQKACCVDDGRGETFFVSREARDFDGDPGVFIEGPPSRDSSGSERQLRGYLVTADEDTECDGGPSVGGPWAENCCSWLFVDESHEIELGTDWYVHEQDDQIVGDVQPVDDRGETIGSEFAVVQVTFASYPAET